MTTAQTPSLRKPLDSQGIRQVFGRYIDKANLTMPLGFLMIQNISASCNGVSYRGIRCVKHPVDTWAYSQIIHETQPSVIVELGNECGGSTVWLNDQIKTLTDGPSIVIGVDIDHGQLDKRAAEHPDIVWVQGDATDPDTYNRVKDHIYKDDLVMVIDDCSHHTTETTKQLEMYGRLVTPGCYYIVEDTYANSIMQYSPEHPRDSVNAMEAIETYLASHDDFVVDRTREHFFITMNPNGFLKKVE